MYTTVWCIVGIISPTVASTLSFESHNISEILLWYIYILVVSISAVDERVRKYRRREHFLSQKYIWKSMKRSRLENQVLLRYRYHLELVFEAVLCFERLPYHCCVFAYKAEKQFGNCSIYRQGTTRRGKNVIHFQHGMIVLLSVPKTLNAERWMVYLSTLFYESKRSIFQTLCLVQWVL